MSTTQISQIRESSLTLSESLHRIESLCQDPGRHDSESRQSSDSQVVQQSDRNLGLDAGRMNGHAVRPLEESTVKAQLPIAASVKLLLDVPEGQL